jgi:hypothetical protein
MLLASLSNQGNGVKIGLGVKPGQIVGVVLEPTLRYEHHRRPKRNNNNAKERLKIQI